MIRSTRRPVVPPAVALATMRRFIRALERVDGRGPSRPAPEARP